MDPLAPQGTRSPVVHSNPSAQEPLSFLAAAVRRAAAAAAADAVRDLYDANDGEGKCLFYY